MIGEFFALLYKIRPFQSFPFCSDQTKTKALITLTGFDLAGFHNMLTSFNELHAKYSPY